MKKWEQIVLSVLAFTPLILDFIPSNYGIMLHGTTLEKIVLFCFGVLNCIHIALTKAGKLPFSEMTGYIWIGIIGLSMGVAQYIH